MEITWQPNPSNESIAANKDARSQQCLELGFLQEHQHKWHFPSVLHWKDWAHFKVKYRAGIWGPQEKIKLGIPLLFRAQVHVSLLSSGGEVRHYSEGKCSTYTKFTLTVLSWNDSHRHKWITLFSLFSSHQHELMCNFTMYLHSWTKEASSSIQSWLTKSLILKIKLLKLTEYIFSSSLR